MKESDVKEMQGPTNGADFKEPEWRHITKAGRKSQGISTSFDDDDSDYGTRLASAFPNPVWNVPPLLGIRPHIPEEIRKIKRYRIPVNYLVTTYVHILASNLDEAIQKGQECEAPDLDIYDTTAHDTTVESEVMASQAEEIEE